MSFNFHNLASFIFYFCKSEKPLSGMLGYVNLTGLMIIKTVNLRPVKCFFLASLFIHKCLVFREV